MIEAKTELNSLKAYYSDLLKVKNLPSIPLVLQQVTELVDNPKTNASQLAKIISKDQGLTAKLLSVANSPLYGMVRRVSTIEYAVLILGFEQIKSLAFALSLMDTFATSNNSNWNADKFWDHSFLTASIAKKLALNLGYKNPGEAFSAGLLHDLGLSVLQKYFKEDYDKIYFRIKDNKIKEYLVEEETIGLNHSDIGLFLLNKWNLPLQICEAVLYHHYPTYSKSPGLTHMVHISDVLANELSGEKFEWDENNVINPDSMNYLKIDDEYYTQLKNDVKENLVILRANN